MDIRSLLQQGGVPGDIVSQHRQHPQSCLASSAMELIDGALAWANPDGAEGWHVFPLWPETNEPHTSRGFYDATRDPSKIRRWWTKWPDAWIGIACGQEFSGLVVVDIDVHEGKLGRQSWKDLKERYGRPLTWEQETKSGGRHFAFRHPGDRKIASRNDVWPGIDVKADGGYIAIAPTPGYTVLHDIEPAVCPPWLLEEVGEPRRGQRSKDELWANKPDAKKDNGRNPWWTSWVGHLARENEENADTYWAEVRAYLPEVVGPGHSMEKALATSQRIWDRHQQKKVSQPREASGWLHGRDGQLFTFCNQGGQGGGVIQEPCSDFDLDNVVIGRNDEELVYQVEVVRHHQKDRIVARFTSDDLASGERFKKLQHRLQISLHKVPGEIGSAKIIDQDTRIMRYLRDACILEGDIAYYLGWQDGGFLHHQGWFGAPDRIRVPHPRLYNWAPFSYGETDQETARKVLQEIATFQEEQTVALFGAWWAAVILKGQLMDVAKMFPFVALIGVSGSGKTTGFFDLMSKLNGNRMGGGSSTMASFRDFVSAHRNGIAWSDDKTNINDLNEILREAPMEGFISKKGIDNTRQETKKMVSPIVVSGESWPALEGDRALRDRAILISPTNPQNRRSLHGDWPQINDITDLEQRWGGDLTRVAGTLTRMGLQRAEIVQDYRSLVMGVGRHSAKTGVLRVGARVWADMIGQPHWVEIVDGIVGEIKQEEGNFLTHVMLPTMLAEWNMPSSMAKGAPICVVSSGPNAGCVRWSDVRLLELWTARRRQHDSRLVSPASLKEMRRQAGCSTPGLPVKGPGGVLLRAHTLPLSVSEDVIDKAGFMKSNPTDPTLPLHP